MLTALTVEPHPGCGALQVAPRVGIGPGCMMAGCYRLPGIPSALAAVQPCGKTTRVSANCGSGCCAGCCTEKPLARSGRRPQYNQHLLSVDGPFSTCGCPPPTKHHARQLRGEGEAGALAGRGESAWLKFRPRVGHLASAEHALKATANADVVTEARVNDDAPAGAGFSRTFCVFFSQSDAP
jgi:hypothetical protein